MEANFNHSNTVLNKKLRSDSVPDILHGKTMQAITV